MNVIKQLRLLIVASPLAPDPEVYWTKPIPPSSGSKLPLLVDRDVLAPNLGVESTSRPFEDDQWVYGGAWKH